MEKITKKETAIDKLGQMIETGFAEIRQGAKEVKNRLANVETDLVGVKKDVGDLKKEMNLRFDTVDFRLNQLESKTYLPVKIG